MANLIRKTLFIGLGGTGNLALKYAKKRFYEIYGKGQNFDDFEIPLIQYLALDTDVDDLEKGVGHKNKYSLKGADCCYMKVANPGDVLKHNPYVENEWMPKKNTSALKKAKITQGAGQIRSFGRVSLMGNYQEIENQISAKIDKINKWENQQNTDFEAMSGGINVVFCFSIAGGTGSGSFLDVAYIVKKLMEGHDEWTSQAYVVLPEIFDTLIKEQLAKDRIWGNSYAALREIEFFMENKTNMSHLELLSNINIPIDGAPFDIISLISDETIEGTKFSDKYHLMEAIGNNVAYKSGNLAVQSNSSWDNIKKGVNMINPLPGNHIPRYVSVGFAELKYDTDSVVDFASKKHGSILADSILDSNNRENENTLNTKVQKWGIKEDEADDLIDAIHANSVKVWTPEGDGYDGTETRNSLETHANAFIASAIENIKQKCQDAVNSMTDMSSEESIIFNIKNSFLGKDGILDKGGVITTLDAIDKLEADPFIARYIHQMTDEIENSFSGGPGLNELLETNENSIASALNDLSDAQESNFLFRKKNCLQVIADLQMHYNKKISLTMEKSRREAANLFYATLKTELNNIRHSLKTFESVVTEVRKSYRNNTEDILKDIETNNLKPFVKNIHNDKIKQIGSQEAEVGLNMFLNNINTPLSSMFDKTVADVTLVIDKYISGSSAINELRTTTLTKYINENIAKNNKDQIISNLQQIKSMGSPISQFNEGAFKMHLGDRWTTTNLWGVASLTDQASEFINNEIDSGAERMATHDDNSIMYSTTKYPAPIFSLKNLQFKYYRDYMDQHQKFSFDIDKRIRAEMDDMKFSLVPKDRTQEKAIFAWIFGIVLNKIDENEGIVRSGIGNYKIKSHKQGSILDQHWCDLNSPWRHLAFGVFEEKRFHLELLPVIKKKLEAMGTNKVNELIEEVKDMDIYITKYSSLNRKWSDLMRNPDGKDKDVLELMKLELEFLADFTTESMSEFL